MHTNQTFVCRYLMLCLFWCAQRITDGLLGLSIDVVTFQVQLGHQMVLMHHWSTLTFAKFNCLSVPGDGCVSAKLSVASTTHLPLFPAVLPQIIKLVHGFKNCLLSLACVGNTISISTKLSMAFGGDTSHITMFSEKRVSALNPSHQNALQTNLSMLNLIEGLLNSIVLVTAPLHTIALTRN